MIVNKIADGWFRSTYLWCWKWLHYQLCHNHCPSIWFITSFFVETILKSFFKHLDIQFGRMIMRNFCRRFWALTLKRIPRMGWLWFCPGKTFKPKRRDVNIPMVSLLGTRYQCDQMWQNFATLAKFKNIWQIFLGLVILYLAKFWTYFGIFLLIGQIFIAVNGHILKKQISILVTLLAIENYLISAK